MLVWIGMAALGADIDATHLLTLYEGVRTPLAKDQLDAARTGALALAEGAPVEVAAAAARLSASSDPKNARLAFGELSRALVAALAAEGPPPGTKVYRCPMAEGWPFWLQSSPGMANPYMGLAMPTCGEGTSFGAAVKAAGAKP